MDLISEKKRMVIPLACGKFPGYKHTGNIEGYSEVGSLAMELPLIPHYLIEKKIISTRHFFFLQTCSYKYPLCPECLESKLGSSDPGESNKVNRPLCF